MPAAACEAFRAELLEDDGRHDEAIGAWRAAIDAHQRTRTRRYLHLWHARLAHTYARLGRREESRREYEVSLRLIDDLDALVALDRFRITLFRDVARVFRQYASRLVEWGEPARAWTVLERGRARDLALRLAQATRPATMTDAEREALARLTDLQRRLQGGALPPARRAELLRQVEDSEAAYERGRVAARRERPPAAIPDFDLPSSDTLVVEYAVNADELLIFSARGGRVGVRRVGGASAVLERVRRFIEAAADVHAIPSVEAPARALAATLLDAELRPSLPRRMVIVADDVLQYLPFGALVDERHQFLAEHIAISTTPSLTTLRELRERSPASDRMLAVGNTRFEGTTFLGQPLPPWHGPPTKPAWLHVMATTSTCSSTRPKRAFANSTCPATASCISPRTRWSTMRIRRRRTTSSRGARRAACSAPTRPAIGSAWRSKAVR